MSELDVAAIRARRARWHTLVSRPEPLDADAGTEIDTIADHAVRDDVPALLDALAARDARVAELTVERDEARADRNEATQRASHWEEAARKNGELYAACENQRDDLREELARATGNPREWHQNYALANGYFWRPCRLCDEPFGGHEWRDVDDKPSVIPDSGDDPRLHVAICPACTRDGRGYRLSPEELLSALRKAAQCPPDAASPPPETDATRDAL